MKSLHMWLQNSIANKKFPGSLSSNPYTGSKCVSRDLEQCMSSARRVLTENAFHSISVLGDTDCKQCHCFYKNTHKTQNISSMCTKPSNNVH